MVGHHQHHAGEMPNDDQHGPDAILYYSRSGDLPAVKRLVLANPAQVNYRRVVTPLMWSCYQGHVEVATFLLDSGADIDQTEEGKGRTALYLASGRGHADVVALLLARGADPSIKRKGGWCPLSVASSEAHVPVVRILLATPGVDVDSRDNDGSTALYRASLWGCDEAVRELLRKGADPSIQGGGGLTPLGVARARNYQGCIDALEDAERIYELAKARKLLRLAKLLERTGLIGDCISSSPQSDSCVDGLPAYLRGRMDGSISLPLPTVSLPIDGNYSGSMERSSWTSWLRGSSTSLTNGLAAAASGAAGSPTAAAAGGGSSVGSLVLPAWGGGNSSSYHISTFAPTIASHVARDVSYDVFLTLQDLLV